MRHIAERLMYAASIIYLLAMVVYLLLRFTLGDSLWWLSLINTFSHLLFAPLLVLLPMTLLLHSRRTAITLLPLLICAAFWIAPWVLPPSPAQTTPNTQTLTILTANLWENSTTYAPLNTWIKTGQADILALQEVPAAFVRDQLAAMLQDTPYQATRYARYRWGNNLLLTRYPLLETEYLSLGHPEYTWTIRAVIDVNGQPVAVYNLHFVLPADSATGTPARIYERLQYQFNDSVRNAQISALLAHLQTEPYPFIVAGDFNLSDQSMTYQQLKAMLTDSWRETARGFGGTWPAPGTRNLPAFLPPFLRIDYIWHSDTLSTFDIESLPPIGSDHLALQATLGLSP